MERSQKENLVGELQGIFNSATAAVLIDYLSLIHISEPTRPERRGGGGGGV